MGSVYSGIGFQVPGNVLARPLLPLSDDASPKTDSLLTATWVYARKEGRREGRVEAWPGLCQGLLGLRWRVGTACRVQCQGLAARTQCKQWCSPPMPGKGSPGKPAGSEQVFSQRILSRANLGISWWRLALGLLGWGMEAAPEETRYLGWGQGFKGQSSNPGRAG